MPTCHRCDRCFASAELRRTSKGHVCKDAVACRRRLFETRSYVVDGELADRLTEHVGLFDSHADKHDPIAALTVLRAVTNDVMDIAADIIERAAKETKLTQKQLAQALGVPASTLRGLRG